MDFSSQPLDGKGVAKFMKGLQKRKGQPHQEYVLGSQNPVGDVFGALGPVKTCQKYSTSYHCNPDQGPEPAEKGAYEWEKLNQEPLWIKDGKTHEQRITDILLPFDRTPLFKTFQQLLRIWWHIALKDIYRMELAEQTNHLFLGRSFLPEPCSHFVPDLSNGSFPIHETDQEIGRWIEALEPARRMVLKNIPDLAAVVVAMNLRMAAEAWF
jgi:hypothetical protein